MEPSTSNVSLLENHEQQYAIISADITSKIGKLSSYIGSDRKQLCSEIEKLIEDAQELMEQMELEVRDLNSSIRSKYTHRISSYKAELTRLSQDFSRVKFRSHVSFSNSNEGLYAEYNDMNSEQKQRLLYTTEQIEETGKHLANGYRIAIETEELGSKMLHNLHSQRETIQSSLHRVYETNSNIRLSSQVLSRMMNRCLQDRLIVIGIFILLLLIIGFTVYFKISRDELFRLLSGSLTQCSDTDKLVKRVKKNILSKLNEYHYFFNLF
ncbi:hypothetical protein PGB90_007940 [Kerria lacca]